MNTKEALTILKPAEKSDEALKAAYRSACLKHHPDRGGNIEIMKLVNAAYELLQKVSWQAYDARSVQDDISLCDIMQGKFDKVKHFPGITAELIGSWLWISGETYPLKSQLKEAGFKFSGKKKTWYYHTGGYRKRSKHKFSMDDIRTMWGSADLDTEEAPQMA